MAFHYLTRYAHRQTVRHAHHNTPLRCSQWSNNTALFPIARLSHSIRTPKTLEYLTSLSYTHFPMLQEAQNTWAFVIWPTTSWCADWSKCDHVTLAMIQCWTLTVQHDMLNTHTASRLKYSTATLAPTTSKIVRSVCRIIAAWHL